MRVFVTGVGGQLGHDVMNELAKRGYEGVGSDIAPSYSGRLDSIYGPSTSTFMFRIIVTVVGIV